MTAPPASCAATPAGLLAEVEDRCRRRWPEARFTRRGSELRWVDGPARLDVHEALAGAGCPRAQLDAAGVELTRRFSRPVLAVVVLAAIDLAGQGAHATLGTSRTERREGEVERWCLHELGQLQLYPIPPGGPPPMPHLPSLREPIDVRWSRARSLVEALGSDQPVLAACPAALRQVLRRMGVLATAAGTDRLGHPAVVRRAGPGPDPAAHPATGTVCLEVPLDDWPDTELIAAIPTDTPVRGFAPVPQLWWTDGPSPAQLQLAAALGGLPDPLAGCRSATVHRQLSATAVAASMLLYHRVHATPFRQRAAAFPVLAALRSPTVRGYAQEDQRCRQRLDDLQQQLLALPLPLDGSLPGALDPDGSCDGARLWAAAGQLLARTYRRRPQLDPRHARRGCPPPRGLEVELGSTLERLGPDALDRLAPVPAAGPPHPGRPR